MFQVRFHGRGGQGVVTSAELLSLAAFAEDRYAQAFPSFGSERMGAPVVAFCRIDDRAIRTREPVVRPDAVIVQDATLRHQVDVFEGLGPDGYLLVNSARTSAELGIDDLVRTLRADRTAVVPVTELALEHLGRPLPGAGLLGGFAALTDQVSLESVLAAIEKRFAGPVAKGNAAMAVAAFDLVTSRREELSRA